MVVINRYCILIANYGWYEMHAKDLDVFEIQDAKEHARLRLETMVQTTNGFEIAEVDLKLRGPGEFFGTRQSGVPELRIANLVEDGELINLARREVSNLIKSDPQLRNRSNDCVRKHFEEEYKSIFDLSNIG